MTDQNQNGVIVNVELGQGNNAEIAEVPFEQLFFEQDADPATVTDQDILASLNEYLADDLQRFGMQTLPRNYVVTRAIRQTTQTITFIVGAKPEYGEASYPTELPDNASDTEKYQPAMEIDNQEDADAYLAVLTKHTARKLGCAWCDAERMERSNLGWYAQYKDRDTFERIRNLFRTETQPALA